MIKCIHRKPFMVRLAVSFLTDAASNLTGSSKAAPKIRWSVTSNLKKDGY